MTHPAAQENRKYLAYIKSILATAEACDEIAVKFLNNFYQDEENDKQHKTSLANGNGGKDQTRINGRDKKASDNGTH